MIYDDVHNVHMYYIYIYILEHISYVHFFSHFLFFIEVQKEVELLAARELVVGAGISRFGSLKFEGKVKP